MMAQLGSDFDEQLFKPSLEFNRGWSLAGQELVVEVTCEKLGRLGDSSTWRWVSSF